ncbi:ABC-type glycerol-3-phosphate transport system substrate-binding protein [Mumia flava]|uniref:ABC-type glycerol-3-phosphate transport system substrate-binding protein n=1 Tax=Mumia flava TaxID=1348852 RepID=A0A0B2BLB9_9ACTN|nr:extracellular solute-binding protein [Mumia flava]PJJ54009.1 ABC-type glycerol-3-phosphate transport system substrate-binding protein [Mumia flava]
MHHHRKRFAAALALVAAAGVLAACDSGDSADAEGTTTITVEGWRPGDEQATADSVKDLVAEFNKENPDIVVEPVEWEWKAETFPAQLAGGTLPTTFRVPFTDTLGLVQRSQIADVTDQVDALPYADSFNPSVLAAAQDAEGRIYGLPSDVYGMGLHYNRALFDEAGLDPDDPPATWDEVRAAAKQITERTGQPGYAEMTKDNTGGWLLTTLTYAFGGRIESEDGAEATIDNPETRAVLEMLHGMRWEDGSMGNNLLLDWSGINQAFAAGKVGMYVGGSDVYNALVTTNDIDPDTYGLTTVPLADDPDAGILGGGSVSVVRADASDAEKEAAVAWNDFFRVRKLVDEEAAVLDAETLAASDQPIGTPLLPVFDEDTWTQQREWIADYINVPVDQMTGFTDNIFDQTLVPEPPSHTQEVYAILDGVVQKVLSDEDADIAALLSKANDDANAVLAQ